MPQSMNKWGVRRFTDAVVRDEPKDPLLQPSRIGRQAAKRLARAQRRATAKIQNAEELLAIARKSGVTARSWQAAILARVIAEEKAREG